MKKITLNLMVVLMAGVLIVSCKKENGAATNAKKRYILSNEYNSVTNAAVTKYFVNDVPTTLGDPSTTRVYGEDLEVSGADVYVLAFRQPNAGGASSMVIYKNGTELQSFSVPSGTYYNCLAVSGNDIYLAGMETPSGGASKIILWKNGNVSSITNNNATDARVYDMVVTGNDVYLAGYETMTTSPFSRLPKYWKNGQAVILTTTAGSNSSVHRIVVNGNDVHCAGDSESKPTYWKNGSPTNLSTSSGWCYGLAISGNDVYTAGAVSTGANIFNAASWKNGSQVMLSNRTTQGSVNVYGIGVDGSDVYVIGSMPDVNNTSAKSVYWKNGAVVELPTSVGSNGYAYRLVIK
jgi:hypothetical protein